MNNRFVVPVALALSAIATSAHGQSVDELGPYGELENRYRPPIPQRLAVEARFGPYKPRVDSGVPGTPYEDTFGTDQRWFGGFEVDWQVLRLHKVLSLGPGFAFSYTRSTANGRLARDPSQRAKQETTLTIMPMYLAAVLRIDALADNTPVPLVPYAKGGFAFAMWSSSDGDETAEDDVSGSTGQDTSYGYVWAAGAMLRLDWLDQDEANTARATGGVDHSYLFAEWHSSRLDGFGSGDSMDVGTDTWVAGLAVEAIF